jgi:diguanylate cyclase (GGDEF)-like protein
MHEELTESYEQLMETNRVIKDKDEKLTYLAYYDVLTNLPNRQLFIDKLDEHIRDNKICTVIYTDVDDFKKINDVHGHNAGDIMLSNFADRLRTFCGDVNFVGRIGGDEFAIILEGNYDERAIIEYVNKIRSLIAEPVSAGGAILHATMSYGIASFPQDGRSSEDLFKCTDVAVFNAKANGKDRPCFYSQYSQYIRR